MATWVSKSESISLKAHVQMTSVIAEINIFVAWYKKLFWYPCSWQLYRVLYNLLIEFV